jgi:Chaperone of endosialidase
MNPLIRLKTLTPRLLAALALVCFVPSPIMQAVVPPPDGGYPGFNTAEGQNALFSLNTGAANTAVGWYSLFSNTDGSFNTGVGAGTLLFNVGNQSMLEGVENTALGTAALLFNDTGRRNTAVGVAALLNNNTGLVNCAFGSRALYSNTIGNTHTAVGFQALFSNTTGDANTAVGRDALYSNATGVENTGIGYLALNSNSTGSSNTALGSNAGSSVATASNVICIGADVFGADMSNTTWIGNVYGVTTQSGTTSSVIVSDTGQLGTVASSERFKKDIATMDKASEAILSLKPVTFYYKSDAKGIAQFGLIAEEVAKVSPALVLPDKQGKPYTVRYDAVNAMLLNEFLKEHRKVEKLEAIVVEQQKQIQALTAGLEKVSVALEMNGRARMVENTD